MREITRWRCFGCENFEMNSAAPGLRICPRCKKRSWRLMKDNENRGLTYNGCRKEFATPKAVVEQNIPGTNAGFQVGNCVLAIPPLSSIVIGVMDGDVVLGSYGPEVEKMLEQQPTIGQWVGQFTQYVGDAALGRTQATPSSKGEHGPHFNQYIHGIGANKDNTATRWWCPGCANVKMTPPMPQGILFCDRCGGAIWAQLDDKGVPKGELYDGQILGQVQMVQSQCNDLNIQANAPCSVVIGVMLGEVVVSVQD